jgi:flagellar hook-associated protein 1 FlgK
MGISSILSMASTAMNAQQTAVQTASQNISNASTPGYSEEQVQFAANTPTVFPYGSVGTGVNVVNITRSRDALLDATYRSDASASSAANTSSTALGQIQDVFGEPSDNGLAAGIDAFWSSWSDLSTDPTNAAAKSVVLESGKNVAGLLNNYAAQLDQLDQSNRQSMNADAGQVNQLLQQVATLNPQIVAAQSNGTSANDLLDSRDTALDQIAQLTGGQVVQRSNGSAAVYVNGQMLVDGASAQQIQVNDGEPPTISFTTGNPSPITGIGGTLGAEMNVSATQIPQTMASLDALAKGLVQTVNSITSGATTYDNSVPPVAGTAGNFFAVTNPPPSGGDPLETARGITVAMTDANDVPAAAAGDPGPGDNTVALQLANLDTTPVAFTDANGNSLGSTTFADFYQQTVNTVATATQQAQDDATVSQTLTTNADTRRQSVSGVSTDQELIDIIQHQHSYEAAARLVSVINDMMDTLVNLGQ